MSEKPYKSQLPRGIKIGYGTAEFGVIAVEFLLRLYLLIFYTDVVGLRADLAGYAVGLAIIWDAITDPLMGSLSDRTQSRFGKRRPYILLGGLALAGSTVLLFSPPALATQAGKFVFLLLSYILLNTCLTIIAVPHVALGGELTFDRDERTELFGWRFMFFNLGGLFGSVIPGLLLAAVEKQKNLSVKASAYSTASLMIGGAVIVSALITVLVTRNLDRSHKPSTQPLLSLKQYLRSWKTVLQNKLFAVLATAYIVATIGLSVNNATALYYYKYRLGLSENQIQIVLAVFICTITVSIPFWIWTARKYGKKWPGFLGVTLLGSLITLTYPLLPAKMLAPPLIVAVVAGLLTGTVVLLDALVADIVDYDELKTGEHREGLYFGFWKMAAKISRAISVAIAGYTLQAIGFVPNQLQTDAVSTKLGLLFGPGVGLFFVIGGLIFLRLPYSNEEHAEVQKQLLERKLTREH